MSLSLSESERKAAAVLLLDFESGLPDDRAVEELADDIEQLLEGKHWEIWVSLRGVVVGGIVCR